MPSARGLLILVVMWTVILLGMIRVVWTAYELCRNAGFVRHLAHAWDHNGCPVPIVEIVEDARIPGRLLGLA